MNRIVCACFSFQFVLFGCCSRWSNGSEASFNKSTPATEPKIHTRRQRERANESLKHFYNKWVVYFCVPCSKIPICRGEKESRYVERGSLYFMFTGNGHRQKTRFRSFVRSFFFCSFFSRSVCVCRFSRVRLIHALFYTPTVGLHSFKMLVCAAYEWDLPLHIWKQIEAVLLVYP